MRIPALAIAGLLLGGCEMADAPGYEAEDQLAQYQLEWRQLNDGSHFGRAGGSSDDNQFGMRCWAWQDGMSRCVEAHEFDAGGIRHITIGIGYHNDLPNMMIGVSGGDGYRCRYLIDYSEDIARSGEALVSNSITYGQPRWSRAYVNKFIADNDVDGQTYYDCLGILRAVLRGSMETLATTEVTESMLQ